MNGFLLAAAILTFITWAIHTFMGTPTVAKPLLEAEMDPIAKLTNYYCWHIVTVVLLVMSGGYLYAALKPAGWDVGVLVTVLSLGFCLWGIVLVVQKKQKTMDMPQWVLFAIITAVAAAGL